MWPWSKIRALEADLQEALATNRNYVESHQRLAGQKLAVDRDLATLRDQNWSLTIENRRLGALMERAVFRDPDTGRMLPQGQRH